MLKVCSTGKRHKDQNMKCRGKFMIPFDSSMWGLSSGNLKRYNFVISSLKSEICDLIIVKLTKLTKHKPYFASFWASSSSADLSINRFFSNNWSIDHRDYRDYRDYRDQSEKVVIGRSALSSSTIHLHFWCSLDGKQLAIVRKSKIQASEYRILFKKLDFLK